MVGGGGGVNKSWDVWWTEENQHYKKLGFMSKLFYAAKGLVLLGMGEGIRRSDLLLNDATLNKPWVSVGTLLGLLGGLMVVGRVVEKITGGGRGGVVQGGWSRGIRILITLSMLACIGLIFKEDTNMIR